jgi:hypothetical protein
MCYDKGKYKKQFKCSYENCDKQYSTKSRLAIHLRTHVSIEIISIIYVFKE